MAAVDAFITTSSGGAATATTSLVNGIIKAVIVTLGTSTSVDVKITPSRNTTSGFEILNKTSISADAHVHPVVEVGDKTGASVAASTKTNVWTDWVVNDSLAITVANGGNVKTLSVKIIYEPFIS